MLVLIISIILVMFVLYWLFLSPYSQIFGDFPYKFKTNQKIIALTFDDGPNEPYTSQLLDFFDKTGVKATFFVVGKNAQKYPDVIKRIRSSGHTLGIHSYNHKVSNYLFHPTYKYEIVRTQNIIRGLCGIEPTLFRPPWLWRHPVLFDQLKKLNIYPVSGKYCYWLFLLEVLPLSPRFFIGPAIKWTKPGRIFILHDGYDDRGAKRQKTVEATKIFVNTLQKKGYKFIALDKTTFIN